AGGRAVAVGHAGRHDRGALSAHRHGMDRAAVRALADLGDRAPRGGHGALVRGGVRPGPWLEGRLGPQSEPPPEDAGRAVGPPEDPDPLPLRWATESTFRLERGLRPRDLFSGGGLGRGAEPPSKSQAEARAELCQLGLGNAGPFTDLRVDTGRIV